MEALLALNAPMRTRITADVEMALAQNPWVNPLGAAADGLRNDVALIALARRSAHLEGSPLELTGDDLRIAWLYGLPAPNRRRLPQLMAVLAWNQNWRDVADIAGRIQFLDANLAVVPRWVLHATVAQFNDRHPGRLSDLFVEKWTQPPSPAAAGFRYATSRVGLNRTGCDGGSVYWIPTPMGSACWAA